MSRLTPSDTYRIWKKGKSEHTTASPLLLVEKSSSQTIAAITALTLFQVQLCVWIPL